MNHFLRLRNILFGAAIFIAGFAGLYQLSEAPAIWYDEGFYTQIAANFAEHGKQLIQTAPGSFVSTSYITVGYPLIAPLSLSYSLFGVGVFQGRAVMLLFIGGLILGAYLLTKKLFGPDTASWSILLLATFPMLYGNGKSVLGEIPGIFFLFATLIALSYLEKSNYRSLIWYAVTGLLAGICIATKPFFLILLGALCITLLIRWKHITLTWRGFVVGTIFLIAPILLWAAMQFGDNASVSGILEDYANPYAIENIGSHVFQNAMRFVQESTPLYTLILMSVWACSLLIRWKKGLSSAEVAAFIFCVLTLLSYLRLEGWYRYLFPATIVALVFLPSSLQTVCEFVSKKIHFNLRASSWSVSLLLILLSAAQLYQTAYHSYVAQYYGGTRTKEAVEALSTLSPSSNIFLYNVPELVILTPSKQYYQYLSPLPKVRIGEDSLQVLAQGVPNFVVVQQETYKNEALLFEHYKERRHFDRYVILEKK